MRLRADIWSSLEIRQSQIGTIRGRATTFKRAEKSEGPEGRAQKKRDRASTLFSSTVLKR